MNFFTLTGFVLSGTIIAQPTPSSTIQLCHYVGLRLTTTTSWLKILSTHHSWVSSPHPSLIQQSVTFFFKDNFCYCYYNGSLRIQILILVILSLSCAFCFEISKFQFMNDNFFFLFNSRLMI